MLADKVVAAPEILVCANLKSPTDDDSGDGGRYDSSMLLMQSPGEKDGGRLPPSAGLRGFPF